MTSAEALASLLLEEDRRAEVAGFFEPRAAAVDGDTATVREGLAFLQGGVLAGTPATPGGPSAREDVARVAETIATVAWSDMSTAFALWCHRMVREYLSLAPAGSPPREELLPRLARVETLGSTALAAAMAHYVSGAPLTITATRDAGGLTLNGRVNWASNLFASDFLMVTAVASADDGRPLIVVVPGGTPGLLVHPHPRLLALQATASSSASLQDVRLDESAIITDDFDGFIQRVRPTFLRLQSSFCWGIARRSLDEARAGLRGVNEALLPDFEALERTASRVAGEIRAGIEQGPLAPSHREVVRLRLEAAQLATAAVALEVKATGGRGYVATSPTARRLREVAFLPIQAPTEGQLRWELEHSA